METPEQLYKTLCPKFNLVNHKEQFVELIEKRDEESACFSYYAANSREDAVIMAEDLILEV